MKHLQDPFQTNHYYYVYNKTIGNKSVFGSPEVCEVFISKLLNKKYFRVDILAYCLLPDSFHFLLRQRTDRGIQSFLTRTVNSYTRHYNSVTKEKGPLFENRIRSLQLNNEQLAYMTRFIHMHPFAAGLVWNLSELEQYPWSSYWEYISSYKFLVSGKEIVSDNPIAYRHFVESGG